jgi:hypothetical protein
MCSGNLIGYLGFFHRGVFIGEGAMSEEDCRCSGYRGIPVHLLLGHVIGPSSAQGRANDPSYGEDPHEEAPREENDGQNG